MSELRKLEREFEEKKKKLQESCSHPSKSEWMDYQWALCHSTGSAVRTCTRCGEILETKTHEELREKLSLRELPDFLLPSEIRIEIYKLIGNDITWKEAKEKYFAL